jgi:NHLM bacteriocin system ABC transporter ATP-binding protein
MNAMLKIQGDEPFEPRPNQPFSIHRPDAVWIVQSGELDLFLVDVADGEPLGARYPLLRVEQGFAIFGMCEPVHGSMVAAVATHGTQLTWISQDRLRAGTPDSTVSADALALLDDWLLRLAACASAAPLPRLFTVLEPGSVLEVSDDPKPIMPVNGILWVEHLRGSSRFLNSLEIGAINSPGYFPVSRNGWLQPTPQARILSVTSSDWQKFDPQWRSLQTFHDVVLQRFIVNRRSVEDADRARRLSRAASDAKMVGDALQSLASPLEKEGAPLLTESAGIADPTFLAFDAIGESLGVQIVPPNELRSSAVPKDLVSRIASASGLRVRRVVLKRKWWMDSGGPLLAFRDADSRPMAVLPASRAGSGYRLYDPVERRSIPLNSDAALTLNGFAYAFYRPFPNRKLSVWDLLVFGMHDARQELLWVLAMGVCSGMLALVFPIATGIIFDSIIPNAQRSQLLQLSSILVVLAAAAWMFILTRNFATLRLEGKMGAALQAAIWDRLLRLPVPFYRRYTSGDLADRSLGIDYILRALTGSVIYSVLSGVFSIFSFLLLFYYSWQLALVATGVVFLTFAASVGSMSAQIRYQRQIFRARGHISGMLLGFIDNIARLRVSGAEQRAFSVWAREFSIQKKLSVNARAISNRLAIFNSAFPVIGLAVIFACCQKLMGQPLLQALTTGTFLAFLAAFVQFQTAALQLSSAVESALSIVPIHERATPILQALPEVSEDNRHPGELRGSIEISHLNFRYHSDAPLVLRDVSFAVRPGEFVAIVGPSGSGKSSLFRLLLGFEKSESGAIYYDSQDMSGLDVQAIRQQMGVVIQNARLASGSILVNIIGSAPLTVDDAWEAARSAGLAEDIEEMPMGMYTIVSEGGANLSGGQRQRLLIARAIVRKPRIFLFDEATSALDNRTQAVVSRSLETLQSTRIVIAHRLSTIVNANQIFVMEKGIVVQSGSYSELASQQGLFRELAKRQLA